MSFYTPLDGVSLWDRPGSSFKNSRSEPRVSDRPSAFDLTGCPSKLGPVAFYIGKAPHFRFLNIFMVLPQPPAPLPTAVLRRSGGYSLS